MCGCADLVLDGVGGTIGHAKFAQAEGGRKVGRKQSRAQHHRLVSIQVPGSNIGEVQVPTQQLKSQFTGRQTDAAIGLACICHIAPRSAHKTNADIRPMLKKQTRAHVVPSIKQGTRCALNNASL